MLVSHDGSSRMLVGPLPVAVNFYEVPGSSWSPDSQRIAYGLALIDEIWISDLQGKRSLVARHAVAPGWSPDGSRVGFLQWSGTVAVSTPEGKLLWRKVGDSFAWSPQGSRILVMKAPYANRNGIPVPAPQQPIRVFDRDGRPLATLRAEIGAWSPDGRRLAYTDRGGLYVGDTLGRHSLRVASVRREPPLDPVLLSWSPDGHTLSYDDGTTVWVRLTGSQARRVSGPTMRPSGWSPSGRYAAGWVISTGSQIGYRLVVFDSATGTTRALLQLRPAANADFETGEVAWLDNRTIVTAARAVPRR